MLTEIHIIPQLTHFYTKTSIEPTKRKRNDDPLDLKRIWKKFTSARLDYKANHILSEFSSKLRAITSLKINEKKGGYMEVSEPKWVNPNGI